MFQTLFLLETTLLCYWTCLRYPFRLGCKNEFIKIIFLSYLVGRILMKKTRFQFFYLSSCTLIIHPRIMSATLYWIKYINKPIEKVRNRFQSYLWINWQHCFEDYLHIYFTILKFPVYCNNHTIANSDTICLVRSSIL